MEFIKFENNVTKLDATTMNQLAQVRKPDGTSVQELIITDSYSAGGQNHICSAEAIKRLIDTNAGGLSNVIALRSGTSVPADLKENELFFLL